MEQKNERECRHLCFRCELKPNPQEVFNVFPFFNIYLKIQSLTQGGEGGGGGLVIWLIEQFHKHIYVHNHQFLQQKGNFSMKKKFWQMSKPPCESTTSICIKGLLSHLLALFQLQCNSIWEKTSSFLFVLILGMFC